MKKILFFTLFFALLPFRAAFAVDILAADADSNLLMPASAMEELMLRSDDSDAGQPTAYEFDNVHENFSRNSRVICFTKDLKGKRFDSRGFGPRQVQEDASVKCEKGSRGCVEMGCQKELYSAAKRVPKT